VREQQQRPSHVSMYKSRVPEHTPDFNTLSLLTYLLLQFPIAVKYSLQIADNFYRAMHMHKRGICRHPVSVHLSRS